MLSKVPAFTQTAAIFSNNPGHLIEQNQTQKTTATRIMGHFVMKLKLVLLYVHTVLSCNKNVEIFTYSRVIACFYLKIDVCQRLEDSADLRTKCLSFQPPFSQQQSSNNFTPSTVVIIATAQLHLT